MFVFFFLFFAYIIEIFNYFFIRPNGILISIRAEYLNLKRYLIKNYFLCIGNATVSDVIATFLFERFSNSSLIAFVIWMRHSCYLPSFPLPFCALTFQCMSIQWMRKLSFSPQFYLLFRLSDISSSTSHSWIPSTSSIYHLSSSFCPFLLPSNFHSYLYAFLWLRSIVTLQWKL